MSKKLFWIAGTKGGIGKSTIATYLHSAAMDLNKNILVFDCDNENRTAYRFIKNKVIKIDPDTDFALDEIIDQIDTDDETEIYIVDMKAGTGENSRKWIEEVPLDDLSEDGIEIYMVGCITSDPDSVTTFIQWAYLLKDKVKYIIVRNEMNGTDFSFFEKKAAKLFEDVGAYLITLPRLTDVYNQTLNTTDTTIKEFLDGKEIKSKAFNGRMVQSRLRKYYRSITDQFQGVLNGNSEE